MGTVQLRVRNGVMVAGAAIAIAGLSSAPALAWKPTKEVKLVIHTAGATSDINNFVREVEKILDPKLPEGVDAMNMPGGGGDRARRYVLSKKGDPNVLQGVTPSNISRPILNNANYRATDFTPIAIMVASPLLVVVNTKSPYKSFKDIIDAAKKNPGKVVQGGGAVGEVDSLYNAMLANEAHVKIPFTPFKSKGITELLGAHVDLIMCNPAQADPYVKSGDFRVVATNMPVPLYPKAPTLQSLGYKFPPLRQYRGFWAPPGISKEAQAYWIAEMKKVAANKDFKNYVSKHDMLNLFIAGDDMEKLIKEEQVTYTKLFKELHLMQ